MSVDYGYVLGKFCVVRTFSAGVHCGTVTAVDGREVILLDSRRIWSWNGAFTLSEISQSGIDVEGSRVAVPVPILYLTEAIEVIPCTDEAVKRIQACHA